MPALRWMLGHGWTSRECIEILSDRGFFRIPEVRSGSEWGGSWIGLKAGAWHMAPCRDMYPRWVAVAAIIGRRASYAQGAWGHAPPCSWYRTHVCMSPRVHCSQHVRISAPSPDGGTLVCMIRAKMRGLPHSWSSPCCHCTYTRVPRTGNWQGHRSSTHTMGPLSCAPHRVLEPCKIAA